MIDPNPVAITCIHKRGGTNSAWRTIFLIACLFVSIPCRVAHPSSDKSSRPTVNAEYVGSETCAECHLGIYNSFKRTDMGRSMSIVSKDTMPSSLSTTLSVYDASLNRYFDLQPNGRFVYQSEYQLGPGGTEAFRNTQQLVYSVGAGRNGVSYLVQRNGYLFEAPLSFYSGPAQWGMSPGFESFDFAFNRPALLECLACHSGRVQPAKAGIGRFAVPPFKELAIGCENCHGPGSRHVDLESSDRAAPASGAYIVNPGKLTPWLADNICMRCHQGLTLRILQPGKTYLDFRPGEPLNDVLALFSTPPMSPESTPSSPLLDHFSLMTASKCFTASNGKLSCLSCHDPHVQPGKESADYYRSRCLACHTRSSCSLPLRSRMDKTPQDDCQSCHMPKEVVTGISHSVLTNHRIVRTPSEPFPITSVGGENRLMSGLVHINAVPGAEDRVSDLTLLQALAEAAISDKRYQPLYVTKLKDIETKLPNSPVVLSALGWFHAARDTQQDRDLAISELARAIDSGQGKADDYLLLSELLDKAGDQSREEEVLEELMAVAPYDERPYRKLFVLFISIKQYDRALRAIRKEVELFPEDSLARILLSKAEQAGTSPDR